MSALRGDNIIERSSHTYWYQGPTFLGLLETVNPKLNRINQPLRFPIQWVNRPNLDFRGFSGTIESGTVEVEPVDSGPTVWCNSEDQRHYFIRGSFGKSGSWASDHTYTRCRNRCIPR